MEISPAQQVILAIAKKGSDGHMPQNFGKHAHLAKSLIKKVGLEDLLEAIDAGTDQWPFTNGPWDIFDLRNHLHLALAAKKEDPGPTDAREVLEREQAWEEAQP